jgi:hypothetical protein
MTLHIFNPEHDIALASNLANFTAPHAGRQLRADLGYLPALWAEPGDCVLVDHVESAVRAWQRLCQRLKAVDCGSNWRQKEVSFESAAGKPTAVNPWGWNLALRASLIRQGLDESLLLTTEQIADIRQLSHRRTAANLLPLLRMEGTVGEVFECTEPEQVEELLARYGQVVMKAPWSSSGRGLRFLSTERTPFQMQVGWFRNLVASQGSVMVEPYYNKVKDFAMEFEATEHGIRYLGLSLFHTQNGAYIGNILTTERTKRDMFCRYLPASLLDDVQQQICQSLDLGNYRGPFGVDMMIVSPSVSHQSVQNFAPFNSNSQFLLHPCVEINLRRTMGHVALAISPTDDDLQRVMRIVYNGANYILRIQRL